jgi:hypothetical protein
MTKRRFAAEPVGACVEINEERRTSMNRFRLFAIGAMLLVALTVSAQQTDNAAAAQQEHGQTAQSSTTEADQHMKMLSERLNLTADQQTKIKPILEHMLAERQKIMQDTSLSNDAREQKEKALHEKASKQARKYLSDDQRKKLDELEQQPHS